MTKSGLGQEQNLFAHLLISNVISNCSLYFDLFTSEAIALEIFPTFERPRSYM